MMVTRRTNGECRIIYDLRQGPTGRWEVRRRTGGQVWQDRGRTIFVAQSQHAALTEMTTRLQARWDTEGSLSQLVIHSPDGRILAERNFGEPQAQAS